MKILFTMMFAVMTIRATAAANVTSIICDQKTEVASGDVVKNALFALMKQARSLDENGDNKIQFEFKNRSQGVEIFQATVNGKLLTEISRGEELFKRFALIDPSKQHVFQDQYISSGEKYLILEETDSTWGVKPIYAIQVDPKNTTKGSLYIQYTVAAEYGGVTNRWYRLACSIN